MVDAPPSKPRPWKRASAWLLILGVCFFASYGFANWIANLREQVPEIVFDWERHIPFVAWTIVAYWSIDLFYAASLFLCRTRDELDTHAKRLLTAQLIAISCFLAAPLHNSFEHPPVEAPFGWLFDALMAFDRPFNQAPALHITLLIVLRDLYAKVLPQGSHAILNAACLSIAASVLTTGQHHFIDVVTGAWLGWLCLWLFPDNRLSLIASASPSRNPLRRTLAIRYALAGTAIAVSSIAYGGILLWLLWIAASLWLVAMTYAALDETAFQKHADGTLSAAARWLFAPYLIGAWVNSRLWTRKHSRSSQIADDVVLGRLPTAQEHAALGSPAVVDVCAELPFGGHNHNYTSEPMLDLVAPTLDQLESASRAINAAAKQGPVLVCCALGLSRSALACAAWLLRSHRSKLPDEALDRVRAAQPAVVFNSHHRQALIKWFTWHQITQIASIDPKVWRATALKSRSAA